MSDNTTKPNSKTLQVPNGRLIQCGTCRGIGVVAGNDGSGDIYPDECGDCGGSGTVWRYESGVVAGYYTGPFLGYSLPEGPSK